MYEEFFAMNERPFAAAPRAEMFYPGRAIEQARQTLERTIDRAEGTSLVIGPAGTGKSLLCRMMADKFRGRFDIALLTNGRLPSRRALLQAILFELGMPYRKLDEGELRLSLLDRLQPNATGSEGLLMMIDEAHLLPLRLLEEVRLITDFMRQGKPRVRLVLAGGAALEERLTAPRLHSLQQRVTARCYLEGLDRSDTLAYVRHQLTSCGAVPENVFTEAALEAIYRAGDGIPRLINQICDHALIMACAGEVKPIDASGIEEAWSDLQQLPTPWSEAPGYTDPRAAAADDSVVEFGLLEDAGVDLPASAPAPERQPRRAAEPQHSPANMLPVDIERETDGKLSELESHLADWEADYEPVIAKQPEVELMLTEKRRDPFGEDFVEEVTIVDRYAQADRLQTAPRAQVYSAEGRTLAALLEKRRADQPKAPLKVAADSHSRSDQPAGGESGAPRPVLRPQGARAAGHAPHADFPGLDPVEPEDYLITPRRATSDADMIIVEDDPAPAVQSPEAVIVHKQEYRQLFARLRRGQ